MLLKTSSASKDDVKELVDYAVGKKFLHRTKGLLRNPIGKLKLTTEGFDYLEKLGKNFPRYDQAFVAMWFDNRGYMDKIYDEAIKPAIELAGYKAMRIKDHQHNNKIDEEIMAQIKRSRFVIADFTSEKDKPRGGVYFEAGYALGLGLHVIWTCREDLIEHLHFDTRQFNHITWTDKDLGKFQKSLINRITVVVGHGPIPKPKNLIPPNSSGRPSGPGRPSGLGRPSGSGRPSGLGRPSGSGRPSGLDRPSGPGRSNS